MLTKTMANTKKSIWKDQRVLLTAIIILLVIVVSIINPKFIKISSISAILQQISVLGVLTMAMTMLLISGGIDLSLGNMMTLSAIVLATVLKKTGNLGLAIICCMAVSTFCGFLNGFIIAKSKCMPLIITLGTSQLFYGASLLITGGAFLNFSGALDFMRKVQLFNFVPLMVLFMIAVVIFMFLLLSRSKFGRRIVAMGGNEKNAYLSGINVNRYKMATYAISGFIVSIGGIIFAARLNSIAPAAGSGYELDALVAAVIGGVTFEGGRGTVFGAFLGCLLTGIISSALDIMGVHAYWKIAITGTIIVAAVVLSNLENIQKKN
ncbi:MAG: ABC transporter permease [Eubacteriales bacterium]